MTKVIRVFLMLILACEAFAFGKLTKTKDDAKRPADLVAQEAAFTEWNKEPAVCRVQQFPLGAQPAPGRTVIDGIMGCNVLVDTLRCEDETNIVQVPKDALIQCLRLANEASDGKLDVVSSNTYTSAPEFSSLVCKDICVLSGGAWTNNHCKPPKNRVLHDKCYVKP